MDARNNRMLNPQSPIPLYRQLADLILTRVRSGDYPPGSRIPAEHTLAATYGIGRPTVRQATDLLVRKRILIRRRGAGTFVRTPQKEVALFSFAGTMLSFRKKGISITTHILKKTRLKKIGEDPENPFARSKAYYLSRLSRVEETPVLIEDIYLDPTFFSGIDRIDLAGQSLSQIADEHFYMRPVGGKQNFRIVYLTGRRAGELDVFSGTPVLLVKRFLHFPRAKNAVYSELYCRTEQFGFSQTIGGIPDDESGLL